MKTIKFLMIFFLWVYFLPYLPAQNLPPQDNIRLFADSVEGGIAPGQMITARDGGFLIAGAVGRQGFLAKLDACGYLTWGKVYQYGDGTVLKGLVELPSGNLVAVGHCQNCAPGDSTTKALVINTGPVGLILRDTTLGRLNFNATATAVVHTSDNRIAVAGSLVWASFLGPKHAFLTILDEHLEADIWNEYDHFYIDETLGLTKTSDGGFALAGFSVRQFLAPRQAQLFRVDKQGLLLWKQTSAHVNSSFNAVQEAPDGKIVAFGQRLVDTLLRKRDAFLAVYETIDGDLLLEKTYGSAADDNGLSLHKVQGGYLAGGIWGEPRQVGWNQRDWIFRLDENFMIRDSFFRDSYLFAHFHVNTIPLSIDGKNFAYISRQAFFSSRAVLFFKRTMQGRHIQLAEAPQHKQLYPRNLNTNAGTVDYTGSTAVPGVYDHVRLDVFRNNQPLQSITDFSPEDVSFRVDIRSELAEYSFRLLGLKNGEEHLEAEACEIVAGDAFLIQGQSNAVAGIPYDPANKIDHAYRHHRNPFVRNFGLRYAADTVFTWHKEADDFGDYADNPSGQWGLIFGKKLVEEQRIPVAILNGAVSGISIDSMMPDFSYHGNPARRYGRFLRRVEQSGLKGNLRAIFMFQGETNAGGGFWDSVNKYYQKFTLLDDAWQEDFPSLERRYLFQIRPGAYWIGATLLTCLQVEEAQRRIAEDTDWTIMSTTGMNHDSTHYFYANGYERAGNDIYRLIVQDLYGLTVTNNIYPPTVDSIWFSNCDRREITLQLRHIDDAYYWTPHWETDFRLEGSIEVSVDSGRIAGSRVILFLSSTPGADFTGLSYTSHPRGSEAPVKNANGIGMLTFYNFPVDPPEPYVDSVRISVCFGEGYLLPDGRIAMEEGVYRSLLRIEEGCDSIILTELRYLDAITVENVEIKNDNGTNNGALMVTIGGGVAPYYYKWDNGEETPSISKLTAGTYTLRVIDANQCSFTFHFEVPLMTTIDEILSGNHLRIFPNPCRDFINVELSKTMDETGLWEIQDSHGKLYRRWKYRGNKQEKIPVADWPAGVYLLTLHYAGKQLSFPIFKQ